MRKLIFLDFDGVLHPDGIATFSRVSLLEEYLLKIPDAEIVITSTWRETHNLDELRNFFSEPFRSRIIGITPALEDGYDTGGRQLEIESFLDSAGLTVENSSWVAVDDMLHFFKDGCPHLILTDSSKGFSEINGHLLLQWYTNEDVKG